MVTLPELMDGREFLVYLGDGGSPNMAELVCGLQANQFNQSKEINQTPVVPCDPPGGQPVMVSTAGAKSSTIEASGFYAREKRARLQAAFDNPDSETWAFVLKGEGYYWGRYHFAQFNLDGSDINAPGAVSVSMPNDGDWAWVSDPTAGSSQTFQLPPAA
ncbi:phage tail tube protein [Inquilinus sp. CA228]|uniref:phage tail tube protein n=1 Tax=Inquilinus sp. CA228 TaxID=3455609 RepID=UPI003F8D8B43